MGRRKKNTGRITVGGNLRRPGITGTQTIVLTQPRRFGIDIADMTAAIRAFENVDYSRRFKLYDLYSDILMDTHLSSVIDKGVEAVLALDIVVETQASAVFRKQIVFTAEGDHCFG